MKKIKFLLTDLDGTLIKSEQPICEALQKCFLHVGQAAPNTQQIMNMFGLPVEVMLTTLSNVKKSETAVIDEFIKEYKVQYPISMVKARLIEGAMDTLGYFYKNGIKICLITSERRANAQHILDALGLSVYIKNIVSRDDVENFKPHPEPLQKAILLMGAECDECAYIGESPFDIQAGIASGVYTIAVPSGHWGIQALKTEHPDLMIDNIGQLQEVLQPHK